MDSGHRRIYCGKDAYFHTIFSRWRLLHSITMVVAFFTSFIACFTIAVFDSKFNPRCPLYAKLRISRVRMEDERQPVTYVVLQKGQPNVVTVWGPSTACSFVLYVPLMSMLLAVIWILLFCIKGGYSPANKQLIPSTCIYGFLVTVVMFVAATVITTGGSAFCESFVDTELSRCSSAQYVHWINYPRMRGFYDYLMRSQTFIDVFWTFCVLWVETNTSINNRAMYGGRKEVWKRTAFNLLVVNTLLFYLSMKVFFWMTTHTWFFHSVMTYLRWYINADFLIAEERETREEPTEAVKPEFKKIKQEAAKVHDKEDENNL